MLGFTPSQQLHQTLTTIGKGWWKGLCKTGGLGVGGRLTFHCIAFSTISLKKKPKTMFMYYL